ncbi:MAG: GNAT family N-acetyltransferase [Gammaproteobacteria bacterium]|jgi:[ribosomal protein S5]-alanine N-acetyltransferase|nr:GNAT family N-acetyltransferase [Gammaproteobacteria bacterium]
MEIRLVKTTDADMLSAYHLKNADHFKQWEPKHDDDYYSASQLKIRLASFVVAQDEGRAAYFIAVENSEILAHCSLTNIIYGPLKGCHIGYGVAEVYEGKGLMMKVCKQAVDHAFNKLKLNRLMAAYMPHNSRSETLLNKLGFNQEGLAKKYLQINGAWEDHVLTSLLNPKNT